MDEEYIDVPYEAIGTTEIARLRWLVNSSLVNALNEEDYQKIIAVFQEVVDRFPDPEVTSDE